MTKIEKGDAYKFYRKTGIFIGLFGGDIQLPLGARNLAEAMTGGFRPENPMSLEAFEEMAQDRWIKEQKRREWREPGLTEQSKRAVGDGS